VTRATIRDLDPSARVPLLFLAPATGGGHRSAALAVAEALERDYPGQFAPVLCDPLTGPGAPGVVRRLTNLYGPITRWAPRAWGALYRTSDSRRVMRSIQWTLFARTGRQINAAIEGLQPAIVVSFHALTNTPGAIAARRSPTAPVVVTVVTDLVNVHSAWRTGEPDCVVVPSASVAGLFRLEGMPLDRVIETGLPVAAELASGPLTGTARAELRRTLGLGEKTFVVVVTSGAEGTGHLGREVRALAGCGWPDLETVAICGRNRRLEGNLRRFRDRAGPARLIVEGFVGNMADWLRCADVVVTRAGPGTLSEATSAGAALVITSHLPGQEEGNTELAVAAGAARYAPKPRDLVREVERLHGDPIALSAMRTASARLGRPGAAGEVASLLAALAFPVPGQQEVLDTRELLPV
jgi:1,2-diacylglycerol 3-beta-galactosyltransferase